jgi:hypothetical protein
MAWTSVPLAAPVNRPTQNRAALMRDRAPLSKFWRFGAIGHAGLHPEPDQDVCRRLRQGTGGPDTRSPEAVHPCDGLAGMLPRCQNAARRPIRLRFARERKAGQLPYGLSHRTESAAPRSNETYRLFQPTFRADDTEILRSRFALDQRLRRRARELR